MSKHKDSLQTHHLYLGAGGMLAVAALVVALTFGLSSAQTNCTTGQHWDSHSNTCVQDTMSTTCPTGYTGTPPNCTMTSPSPSPTPTYTDPAAACATAGGTYNAANSPPCTMPGAQTCPSGQWWDMASSTCKSTSGTCTAPAYWDPATSTCKTPTVGSCTAPAVWDAATSTCKPPTTAGTCSTGQWWDTATNTCKSSTDATDPQAGCTRAYGTWKPADSTHTQSWCDMSTAGGQQGTQWTTTRTACPTSKPISCEANNAYTCTVTQVECDGYRNVGQQPQQCPTGQHRESGTNGCVADQTFRTCGPNEYPTTNNPCRPAAHDNQACPSDQYRDSTGACVPMSERPPYDRPPPPPDWQPGQCQQDQQQCPNRFNPSGTVCMPKQLTWDPKTNTRIDPPRPATCADFEPPPMPEGDRGFRPPFGPQRDWGFGFGEGREGEGREDRPMNPCEANPNDPFCQFGFDFNKFGDENKFDESMFDFNKYEVRNIKQELKNLKREAKGWSGDAKQARQQLKESSRESSGFACPAASEVDALAAELENAASQVGALTEASSEEEIQRGLGLRDHVNGQYNQETGEQTSGIRSKLYGGPPDPETGEPTQGKVQGLNVCRELSGVIFGACQAYKDISREFENIKENAPAEAVAVFEEVLPELKSRCENPLAVLAEKGVSLDVLSEPWYPDPEVCSFGGFGGFPGGEFQPPMMPFGDMPPEMMEMMMEKMKEFGGGLPGGGFSGGHRGSGDDSYPEPGYRGRDFQSSVLMAPSHPFFDEDEDEDFGDDEGFGFGPPEMPDECKPPVMRYLGMDEIMRKLDQVRPLMAAHFESMNACKMFEMGKKMSDRESVRGGRFGGPPPEVQNLMALGLEACEAGDNELVDKIRAKMMRFGRRTKGGFGGAIDVDKAFKDKFKEKFEDLVGDDEDADSEVAKLQKQISDLQGQLDEAQQMVFALKEELANLGAQLAATGVANQDTMRAVATLGDLPNADLSAEKVADQTEILALVQEVKEAVAEALPAKEEAKAEAAIDAAVKSLVLSPPSDQVLSDIKESLVTIQSYASSGATKQEVLKKVQEEAATVAALNSTDVTNKVTEGICASLDTCNHGEWFAVHALRVVDAGLADPKAQNFVLNPAKETTVGQNLVRAVNLACDNGILEDCSDKPKTADDPAVKAALADAKVPDDTPWWAAVPMQTLVNQNPEAAKVLSELSPTQTATREVTCAVMATALELPDVPETRIADVLPDDAEKSRYAPYIAECIDAGFMSTTDGEHFTPGQNLSVSQDFVIASNANEYLKERAEEGSEE